MKSVTVSDFQVFVKIAVKESMTEFFLVKLQGHTVYDTERVNTGVCF